MLSVTNTSSCEVCVNARPDDSSERVRLAACQCLAPCSPPPRRPVLAGGCGSADDWSEPHAKPSAVGTLGPGFVDPEAPPAPEATITPRPGSWDAVHPSKGYRVVLLTAGQDAPTKTLVSAVTRWAEQEHASLKTVIASRPEQHVPRIVDAMGLRPDLIIAAGSELVDALDLVTASHLNQQFLVIGGELDEPTVNVTAATFTREPADRAVRAGVAAVLNGLTGIVVRLG